MAEPRHWYVVSYDIRDPQRWRAVYKLLRGFGTRLQYSVFRCALSARQFEKLRWELAQRLASEDGILYIGLCNGCVRRIKGRNRPGAWGEEEEGARFRIV
jgi:CRISPR-associated protein Cas2